MSALVEASRMWREVPAPRRGDIVRQMGQALRGTTPLSAPLLPSPSLPAPCSLTHPPLSSPLPHPPRSLFPLAPLSLQRRRMHSGA